ncbi:MAG: polyprenyl synthetase family protein [Treponema sp.]|nr:polyprenyl synthetase family protein [Treponema sp.]
MFKLPPELQSELALVEKYLLEFINFGKEDKTLGEIVKCVIENSGKMIRPSLLLLSGRFGPGYPECRERLCKLGALLEMVHIASLVHDDIIDDSPLRRGKPTIQSRFGKDMAVFTGDFVLSRVLYHLMNEGLLDSGIIIGETISAMCRGEIEQFNSHFDPDATIEGYLSIIRNKTASVFIASCSMGARESGCDGNFSKGLTDLGNHIGHIFQIRDDLLDFQSSEQKEGKPVHVDFRGGIFTLPVLYALQHPEHGKKMRELIIDCEKRPVTDIDIAAMEKIAKQSGGIDFAKEQIVKHTDAAYSILKSLPDNEGLRVITAILKWISSS